MPKSRPSHRYPRRGERIAPQTLREFLLEPIPGHLLCGPDNAGLHLCDLDETAWQRFSAEAIEELARLVVERVAACHGRRAVLQRQFPRPPRAARLADLPLENRTRRCLAREGFEENLEALGDRTLGDIMCLRAFGPRCLVDLLVALESAPARSGLPRERKRQDARLSEELTAAAAALAGLPEAAKMRHDDPRFARLIESVDAEAATAAELAERLLARTQDPSDPASLAEQVRQLARRIESLSQMTLEQELIDIFGVTPYPRNREILIGYYGWADGRQHTLTEVGNRFGITRERVRQVCAKLIGKVKQPANLPAPVTERVLRLIETKLPCSAAALEADLRSAGCTAVDVQVENVATGAALLGRTVPFRVVKVDAGRLVVRPGQEELVLPIVDLAKKEVYFHGLTTLRRVEQLAAAKSPGRIHAALVSQTVQLIDGFAWLDPQRGWFRLLTVHKHGLPKTVEKILAVAGEARAWQMRAAMGRNRRLWKDPPPEEVLLEFCRRTPGVRVEGDRIIADPPRNWKKTLTGVELRLVSVLKKHGPVMERGALEDLCVAGGMNRFSFHAFISWSPVIAQYGHSVYGLLGAEVSPQQIASLVASRRAKGSSHRVLDDHGRTADGKVWLRYRLSKAASTYAVITIPAALKQVVRGRFSLLGPDGKRIGTLATKDGRAWGLGTFLRQHGARIDDHIVLTLDLKHRTAAVSWAKRPR